MKLFINLGNQGWICNRIIKEFYEHNKDICTDNIDEADVIWWYRPWLYHETLAKAKGKRVLTTIHHVDPTKFDKNQFMDRDKYTTAYHVPNNFTKEYIKQYTKKPIIMIPYWVNQNNFYRLDTSLADLRKEFNINENDFVVGSFQRDTEGHDMKTPKLSKGPDIFCDVVIDMHKRNPDLTVLLAGYRRNYVTNRLKEAGVNYVYHEMIDMETLNKFYNLIDLYLVSSRDEGGPQSILECGATKTNLISTNCGIAPLFVHKESMYTGVKDYLKAKPDNYNELHNAVKNRFIPSAFDDYRKILNMISIEVKHNET